MSYDLGVQLVDEEWYSIKTAAQVTVNTLVGALLGHKLSLVSPLAGACYGAVQFASQKAGIQLFYPTEKIEGIWDNMMDIVKNLILPAGISYLVISAFTPVGLIPLVAMPIITILSALIVDKGMDKIQENETMMNYITSAQAYLDSTKDWCLQKISGNSKKTKQMAIATTIRDLKNTKTFEEMFKDKQFTQNYNVCRLVAFAIERYAEQTEKNLDYKITIVDKNYQPTIREILTDAQKIDGKFQMLLTPLKATMLKDQIDKINQDLPAIINDILK